MPPPPSQFFRVLFLGLIFSLFLFQCKDKTLPIESINFPQKGKFDVPLEKAKTVGINFTLFWNDEKLSNKNAKISSDNPNENKEIEAVDSKKDEKGNTLMYMIKYKKKSKTNNGGGYLVLSADSRAEPILAYSEEDEYDATNPGLAILLEDFAKQIIAVRKTNKEPSDKVKKVGLGMKIIKKIELVLLTNANLGILITQTVAQQIIIVKQFLSLLDGSKVILIIVNFLFDQFVRQLKDLQRVVVQLQFLKY